MPYKNYEQTKANAREFNRKRREDEYWQEVNRQYSDLYRADPEGQRRIEARYSVCREFLNLIKLFYGCSNPSCKYAPSVEQLHFHHLDKSTKSFGIGAEKIRSRESIIEEINKTMVLCLHCHAAHHKSGMSIDGFRRCELNAEGKPTN
jgi:hypothetical protein